MLPFYSFLDNRATEVVGRIFLPLKIPHTGKEALFNANIAVIEK